MSGVQQSPSVSGGVARVPQTSSPAPSRVGAPTSADRTTFGTQFNALFRKNLVRQSRQKVQCCCQILFPVLVFLLLFIIQTLVTEFLKNSVVQIPGSPNPTTFPKHTLVYDPNFDASNCGAPPPPNSNLTFFYIPPPSDSGSIAMGEYGQTAQPGLLTGVDMYSPIVDFRAQTFINRAVIPQLCYTSPLLTFGNQVKYVPFFTKDALNEHLYDVYRASELYAGGYQFNKVTTDTLDVTVQYNDTFTAGQDLPLLINRITTAILRYVVPTSSGIKLDGYKNAPSNSQPQTLDLVSLIGPSLYVFIFQLSMPLIVGAVVYEKEYRLREIMKMMGLRMKPYWVVTYIYSFTQYFLITICTIIIGAVFGFRFYTANNGGVLIVFLFLWGHTMVAFSLFVSTLFSRSSSATISSYLWVFGTGLLAGQVAGTFLQDETTSGGVVFVISIIPTGTLFRGLRALGTAVSFDRTGITFDNMNEPYLRMGEVWGYLIALWAIFMILAVYFEEVLPTGYGIKRHPCFCVGYKKAAYKEDPSVNTVPADEPEDLRIERARANTDVNGMLRICSLRKVYPADPPKVAVRNLSMVVDAGQCFGFLGSNGAGKTTTINIVTGLFPPTSGTAFVDGLDIRTDIDAIHTRMGVCPQDNILWGDLTGREHLLFYGRIKNLKGKELEDAVQKGLESVNLADPSTINKLAREYSGGMQRRLSVAMALIGNPKIVLLDEPSTGLDPASRRQLWDIILQYKTKCAMLLTTHAMEEADALCDRLALFDSGRLQCIDTSAQLKRRFGKGFKVTVTGPAEAPRGGPIDSFVMSVMPRAALLNHLAGTRNYEVPKEGVDLATVFERFEKTKEHLGIKDWGISNTTLEEVFLRVNGEMDDGPTQTPVESFASTPRQTYQIPLDPGPAQPPAQPPQQPPPQPITLNMESNAPSTQNSHRSKSKSKSSSSSSDSDSGSK